MIDRWAKIVATLGPASQEESVLTEMIMAGVSVLRLNFSHGKQDNHAQSIEMIRRVSRMLDLPVCILQDLQGPKIRIGHFDKEVVMLVPGQAFALTSRPVLGDKNQVSVDYPDLPAIVSPGNRILLDDGNLELAVTEIQGDRILTRVVVGGPLKSNKGVNVPGAELTLSALTPKDEDDLAFGLAQGIDAVALSFVRRAADIEKIRQRIAQYAPDRKSTPVIAKLERPEALNHLDEIIDSADGVMVARGDLGVELSPEAVPIAQKQSIAAANRHAKVVITATQMLETMIVNRRPTRAEASYVANAIFDGTDAVMLSAETAAGKYPVEAVRMMDRIIHEAESHFLEWGEEQIVSGLEQSDAASMARAAKALANDINVTAVACFTTQGESAWLMSKIRTRVPILGFTPNIETARRLAFLWGLRPQVVPFANSLEEMLDYVDAALMRSDVVEVGDQVVMVCGFPVGAIRPPNMALLHTVGEER
jgi:pyruvate kinase